MDYTELYDYVKELKDDIKDVKADIKDVKADVKGVKQDIKNTYEEVKKTNGRLRQAEGDIIHLNGVVEARGMTCGEQIKKLAPVIPIMTFLNYFAKSPKVFLFIFVAIIVGLQVVVQEAVQNNWLSELINYFKP